MASSKKVQAADVCMWCISSTFFLFLISGGLLLSLYLALPESETTMWFPAAGVILVGVPWAFWIVTCFHRLLIKGKPPGADIGQSPYAGAAAPATSVAGRNDPQVINPAGGASTPLPSIQEDAMEEGMGGEHNNGNSERTDASLGSQESERPLALSISS